MQKFLMTIISILALTIFGTVSAWALTSEEFRTKAEEFMAEKIKPDAMLKLCNDTLAKDVGENKDYASDVYSMRSHAYWVKNDIKRAEADAKKAVELNPATIIGRAVLVDALTAGKKYEEAAKALESLAAEEKDREKKKGFIRGAEDLRLQAKMISPAALWKAFDNNEVAANDLYKGKSVALRGKIAEFNSSMMGYPEIDFFIDGYGFNRVKCQFSKSAKEAIAKMKKGQTIQLVGICRGMVIKSVSLDDCRLLD